jgi:hypothetical protein
MTHEERVYHHEMETCEGIHEHAERIAALEELVLDMYRRFHGVVIENWSYSSDDFYTYEQRMAELGVEP